VLAEVDDGVGAELLDRPPVRREVVVRRGQVGVVVDGDGVLAKSPRRLDADEDVTEPQARDDEPVPVHVQLARRRSPVLLHVEPQLLRQPGEPFGVTADVESSRRAPQLVSVKNSGSWPPAAMSAWIKASPSSGAPSTS
jgi:hypothetical protein